MDRQLTTAGMYDDDVHKKSQGNQSFSALQCRHLKSRTQHYSIERDGDVSLTLFRRRNLLDTHNFFIQEMMQQHKMFILVQSC
jgi:hypothetical protein